MHPLSYSFVFVIPGLCFLGLLLGGSWVWAAPVLIFGLVPVLELRLPAPTTNPDSDDERARKEDWRYSAVILAAVPVQIGVVLSFLMLLPWGEMGAVELMGATLSVGLCCGGLGINIAHELGHRRSDLEQFLAKVLLSTSLYAHFFIEHNRGHHARVATHDDPATSRRGEVLFSFWVRSIIGGWKDAWQMEVQRLQRRKEAVFSLKNEMVRWQGAQILMLIAIALIFGIQATLAFVAAAITGILLLETVNYLEHYGLQRQRKPNGSWERVRPAHSWNSNCVLGRLLLFELSRHSDHHANPKRPYPLLRHFDEAPQLPTGYPGMILAAFIPPLFFALMEPRLPQNEGSEVLAGAA